MLQTKPFLALLGRLGTSGGLSGSLTWRAGHKRRVQREPYLAGWAPASGSAGALLCGLSGSGGLGGSLLGGSLLALLAGTEAGHVIGVGNGVLDALHHRTADGG